MAVKWILRVNGIIGQPYWGATPLIPRSLSVAAKNLFFLCHLKTSIVILSDNRGFMLYRIGTKLVPLANASHRISYRLL